MKRFSLCSQLLAVVLAASVPALPAAAPRAPDGKRLFQKQCANCHGKAGEGVKEKYAEALTGDWSVAKLTRYVEANMPDDDPGTLSTAEAEAVSRYLHEAFYSRAAQARLHPVRVELAHLTGHQHVVTVADLVRGFDAADAPASSARGLEAVYYNAARRGGFDNGKVVHRGLEAVPDLDAASNGVRQHLGETKEFSLQWRGAILADETGEYEFVVRTPNSVRFWINAPFNGAEAQIDANVSNPADPNHRVTVRLIGGRRYPIGLDYWALPGKPGAPAPTVALRWKPPHGSERTIPARNLSPDKVAPTFILATHFPADDSSFGYERSTTVSKAWDEATTGAAFEVANHVARKLDRFAGTRAGDPERPKKIEAFAAKFVTAAFRRPLTADETNRYITTRFKSAPDADAAMRRVVLLALKSPSFLYPELPVAKAGGKPEAAQVAARLSFGLWDSAPDPELRRAAAEGRLGERAAVTAQAERMLGDPRAQAKLQAFFHQWLQMRFLEDLRKDAALFPDFSPELIDDLRTSLNLFVADVAWGPKPDYRDLLRAETLFVNDRLARFYGLPSPADGEFVRVATPPGERSGVLTHPYLLAAFAYKGATSPIHRGVFLTRNIVGRTLKSPPMAVAFNNEEFPPGLSMREKVTRLTRQSTCQGCHAVINPLGFTLEWYDAVGRFRREENGRPVDAAGEYRTDDNQPVKLTGPRDVAEFAIASERGADAFIEQLFHQVVRQPIMAFPPDTLDRLRNSFIASDYNLRKLLVDVATTAALRGLEPVSRP